MQGFFKKWLPNKDYFLKYRSLKLIRPLLEEPAYWRLGRHNVARSFLIGLFFACIPLPLQTLLAALLAVHFRANIALAILLVWLSNPITMPPLFYFTYHLGAFILQWPVSDYHFEFSWHWFATEVAHIWWPLILGSVLTGAFLGLLGYFSVLWIWRWFTVRRWRARNAKRRH